MHTFVSSRCSLGLPEHYRHFASLRSNIRKSVKYVCELVSGQILGLMVPGIDSPSGISVLAFPGTYGLETHQFTK